MTPKKKFLVFIVICAFMGLSLSLCSLLVGPPGEENHKRLVSTIEFLDMPEQKKEVARKAISALLDACPRIEEYATHGETITVDYYPEGWEKTQAHFDVEFTLNRDSLATMPHGLRDPQWGGHVEFGLAGDDEPGAVMQMPLPYWLCGLKVDDDILSSMKRDWEPHKILMPIAGIVPNSF